MLPTVIEAKSTLSCMQCICCGFCVALFAVCLGCSSLTNGSQSNKANLNARILQFYDYLKDRNFDECMGFFLTEEKVDQTEAVKYLDRYFQFQVVDYKIESIVLKGGNAEVRMFMNIVENNEEYPGVHCDSWLFAKGNWYISDFARVTNCEGADEEGVVREYKVK